MATVCAGLFEASTCDAQLNFPQFFSPIPVGSGARAAGMANAFVAVADDATAASWNPAGLVQLELPEFSVVGAYSGIQERFSNQEPNPDFPSGFASTQRDSNLRLNFMSAVYPAYVQNHNLAFSLSYQERLQFDRNFSADFNTFNRPLNATRYFHADLDQNGSFSVITPSIAISLTPRFSLGVSFNLWRSSVFSQNDFETHQSSEARIYQDGVLVNTHSTSMTERYDDFSGENLVLGLLWSPTPRWNLAVRYDTPFTGRMDYIRESSQSGTDVDGGTLTDPPVRERRSIRLPPTFALGTAVRVNDPLTLSADASWTDWDNSYVELGDGARLSLVDGVELKTARSTEFDTTLSVRLGAEYVLIPKQPRDTLKYLWTVRGGLFYEEEPASGRPTSGLGLFQPGDGRADSFYGVALGLGLLAHQRVNLDFAYQLRYGNNVNSDYVLGVPGFSEDVIQHRFLLSAVVYFQTAPLK
jgi:long-subunit fatty acid transport protein